MASGGHNGTLFARRPNHAQGAPLPPSVPSAAPAEEVAPSREDLKSWWRQIASRTRKSRKEEIQAEEAPPPGIFGVPLQTSIKYANVAISLYDENGRSYIYGYVPIVVAKCGVFLKEKATDVEGIFRLSGSERRIKELRDQFNSPDRYGKGLDWAGYTVHDAANVLRRYFNQLPEPVIPLEFYERFRDPLRHHQAEAVGGAQFKGQGSGKFDMQKAIKSYQELITELPPLNRQLLLYILDLLAVFAAKSDHNKMTIPNLAAIFQPGLLSHPNHDMSPEEYRLSQDVLIFLIDNQDHFLFGMQGTAADEKTVQEVQSGAATPTRTPSTPTTPGRSKTVIGRSSSNASAGAESVRKYGGVRRNVSVSSRGSKHSTIVPSPISPAFATPASGSGVHRSNTLPSRRSPANTPSQFNPDKLSGPPSPGDETPTPIATSNVRDYALLPPTISEPKDAAVSEPLPRESSEQTIFADKNREKSSEDVTPTQQPPQNPVELQISTATPPLEPQHEEQPSANDRNASATPSTASSTSAARKFTDFFTKSPHADQEKDKPERRRKKLQKRTQGQTSQSTHNSTQSLVGTDGTSDGLASSPVQPSFPVRPTDQLIAQSSQYNTAETTIQLSQTPTVTPSKGNLAPRPTVSPTTSFVSTDHSEFEPHDEPGNLAASPQTTEKAEKKRRWRFSSSTKNKDASNSSLATSPPKFGPTTTSGGSQGTHSSANLGSIAAAERSMSSIGSGGKPRKSFTGDSSTLGGDGGAGYSSMTSSAVLGRPSMDKSAPNGGFSQPGPQTPGHQTAYGSQPQLGVSSPGNYMDTPRDAREAEQTSTPSEKKGPLGWFRDKWAENRDRREAEKAEKRAKSPSAGNVSRQSLAAGASQAQPGGPPMGNRGRSMDIRREDFSTSPPTQMAQQVRPQQLPMSPMPPQQAPTQYSPAMPVSTPQQLGHGPTPSMSMQQQPSPLQAPPPTSPPKMQQQSPPTQVSPPPMSSPTMGYRSMLYPDLPPQVSPPSTEYRSMLYPDQPIPKPQTPPTAQTPVQAQAHPQSSGLTSPNEADIKPAAS